MYNRLTDFAGVVSGAYANAFDGRKINMAGTHRVEISEECLSRWGRMVKRLNDLGISYRRLAQMMGAESHTVVVEMLQNPSFMPRYDQGHTLRRIYQREILHYQTYCAVRAGAKPIQTSA